MPLSAASSENDFFPTTAHPPFVKIIAPGGSWKGQEGTVRGIVSGVEKHRIVHLREDRQKN